MFFARIILKSTSHKFNIVNNLSEFEWSVEKNKVFSYGAFEINILETDANLFNFDDYIHLDKQSGDILFIEGNIYNLDEIGIALGIDFKKHKNPFILYKAYLRWGKSFPERLNGDFSIAVFEQNKNKVTFYRDHLGIQPTAISLEDNSIYFSSDPIGLCKFLYGDQKINTEYLIKLFLNLEFFSDVMPHEKIIKTKAGHYLEATKESIKQYQYWHPDRIQTDQSLAQGKVLSELKELVIDAVNIRSDKDKNAATHLSGGLDSGIVGALARKNYEQQKNFYGFCWSPEDEEVNDDISHDERILVNETAQMHNIQPIYTSLDYKSYQEFFSDWRHPSEMMYESKTLEAAKIRGVNLIFSGWGGDDFISIGHKGIDADLIRQFKWNSFLKKYPLQKPKNLLRALVYNVLFPSLRMDYTNYKCEKPVYPYIKRSIGLNKIPKSKRFKYNSRRKVHLQLLKMGHLYVRTNDWYIYGQKFGIEYRYPLLDKRIIEYMLKVPSHCLVGNNHHRIILREIGKHFLPKKVLKNTSKDDPVKSQKIMSLLKKINLELIDEFEDFRNNPDLDFVDFKLLEKNIPQIQEDIKKNIEAESWLIFYFLKKAHEFTKGYYKKDYSL